MSLIGIVMVVVFVALIGFLVYLVTTYVPMPEPFKMTIIVVVVCLLVLYVIGLIAGSAAFPTLVVPRLR